MRTAGKLKRYGAGILLFLVLCCLLGGCSIEKVRAGDGVKPEYTVMKEEDYPEKVKELISENREEEFQMTYQDQGYLYLLKGYGKQETGGYSIQIEDLSLWENAIHLKTVLMGPEPTWHGTHVLSCSVPPPGQCHGSHRPHPRPESAP